MSGIDPSATVHPMAVVEDGAQIGAGCTIGPFAIIGPEVTLAENVTVKPHALVTGWTEIGAGCTIFSFASVGEIPQDLKYAGERTRLVIGRNCRIRENATLHSGTEHGGGITRMGDNCLVMAGAHVGHDAQIGNNVILANYAGIAGHVVIEDNVIVGALSGIHQFVRIGEGAIIGGVSRVTHDVMPFGMVASSDGTLNGLNLIGLKRRGMAREDIAALREAYRTLADTDAPLVEAARDLGEEAQSDAVRKLAAFFTTASGRSFFASAMTRTALIAGRGDLPELVAARLALEGLPPVLAELEGFESLSLAREGVERFRLERLVPFLDRLVDFGGHPRGICRRRASPAAGPSTSGPGHDAAFAPHHGRDGPRR